MGGKPHAFKHQLGAERARHIATMLAQAAPGFDGEAFLATATRGLAAMELKARVRHLITCLHGALPQPFPRAVAAIIAAVDLDATQHPGEARWLRGFAAWPLIDYIGEHGLDHLEVALGALRQLTESFSAEFAIRPFLAGFPAATLRELSSWTNDPNEHVRRLVSEGTRPLLPWGQRLQRFRDDPAPVIALLERLKADPSEYVRRSVANNLNDISKDHPAVVVELCRRWTVDGDSERDALIKRALRTLVKRGDHSALALLGFGAAVAADLRAFILTPSELREGASVELSFELASTSASDQRLNIDYAVHYVKANHKRSAKVFKLKPLSLAAGAMATVRKKHSMKVVTTRVHYPGLHTIEILVNGKSMGSADFVLLA